MYTVFYQHTTPQSFRQIGGDRRWTAMLLFNDVLVRLFNEIMDIEERAIITEEFKRHNE